MQLSLFCKGQPGTEDLRCIQHHLHVWQGIKWTSQLSKVSKLKDHHWHSPHGQLDKDAVAEHRFDHHHHIQLQGTKILSIKPSYMDRIT